MQSALSQSRENFCRREVKAMILNEKRKKGIRLLATAAVVVCMLTACGFGKGKESAQDNKAAQEQTAAENGTPSTGSEIAENSIVNFKNDKAYARLKSDMEKGDTPIECNVLFDVGGARPDVTVTDEAKIKEIYDQLAKITVGEKSTRSVTDSYHHITFRLRNDTYVSFYFEGEDLFCWEKDNYAVSGGSALWYTVRGLQDTAMEEAAKTASAGSTSNASKPASPASAQSSTQDSSGKTSGSAGNAGTQEKEKQVLEEVTASNEPERDLPDKDIEIGTAQKDLEVAMETAGVTASGSGDRQTEDGGRGKNVKAGTIGDTPAVSDETIPSDEKEIEKADRTDVPSPEKDISETSDEEPESDASAADDAAAGGDTASEADTASAAATAADSEIAADIMQLSEMDAAYTDVILAYAEVLSGDADTFNEAYEQGSYDNGGNSAGEISGAGITTAAADIDPRLNYDVIHDCFKSLEDAKLLYGLHDYNRDGIPELVIALKEAGTTYVRAMYSFDGTIAVPLFTGDMTLVYRRDLYLLPDNTFIFHGSGSAVSGEDIICRIADGGSGLEIISRYEYDGLENGNMDHVSPDGETLTEEEFNEQYGDVKNPAEGVSFEAVSETARVNSASAE